MTPSLEQIWQEFSEPLRQFLLKRVSNPVLAEDLLQEVFLKASAGLARLTQTSRLPGWLFRIARNAVIDHYRTRKETVPMPDTLAAPEAAPESGETEALQAAFRRMIHSLPTPYHEAILRTEFEGLTQAQYAEQMGISLSAAKSRVQRGGRNSRSGCWNAAVSSSTGAVMPSIANHAAPTLVRSAGRPPGSRNLAGSSRPAAT
ncbi:MAG: sigma-70 family RNA polymerase sigma factor [Verrucomicrobia bacterium]|nr:sigma-70 family RNA polymerase sigma factor [Verrucomicrobiota bacterium]